MIQPFLYRSIGMWEGRRGDFTRVVKHFPGSEGCSILHSFSRLSMYSSRLARVNGEGEGGGGYCCWNERYTK